MEIVKIRNLYKFLFRIVTKITIKRYIYSIDDDFDIWFRLEMRNDKFREFPLIPDWGIMPLVQYNSRFCLNIGLDVIRMKLKMKVK